MYGIGKNANLQARFCPGAMKRKSNFLMSQFSLALLNRRKHHSERQRLHVLPIKTH